MCVETTPSGLRQRGVSMIELLVGLVIAALVGLSAFAIAVAGSAAQRQAVGTGATSAALITALGGIKTEIGSASLGFTIDGEARCARLNMTEGGVVVADGENFLPVAVARSASSPFDVLRVVQATDTRAAAPVRLSAPAGPGSATLALRSWLPVSPGQRILIAPDAIGDACTVRTVEGVTPAVPGGTPYTLNLAAEPVTFAGPSGYVPDAIVGVLGNIERRTIRVDASGNLVMESSLLGGSATLVENVVAWRVQYGVVVDPTSKGIEWVDPTGPWALLDSATAQRIRALRLGIVARSPQREKVQAGACVATTSSPDLFGETIDVAATLPDWGCFRYRRAEVVVPLRNIAWGGV